MKLFNELFSNAILILILFIFNIQSLYASNIENHIGTVTYSNTSKYDKEKIEHGELVTDIDEVRRKLHAQHHQLTPLSTMTLPGKAEVKPITTYKDYALSLEDLVLVHPGKGEYVHVMEGKRHGYNNLSIGITNTEPGGSPPMHTHPGEESHVLLNGIIEYAVGNKKFTVTAPYIMQIPPMVPHSFRNKGDSVANIVVIFPTNIWEYDILDYFPFND